MDKQNYLNENNQYFKHLLSYKKLYLISFTLIIFLYVFLVKIFSDRTIMMGAESYYHLSNSSNQFNLWNIIIQKLPNTILYLIPPILTIAAILLFIRLTKNIELSERFTFIFLALLITTPTFILTATTISSYSLFIFLILAGSVLLTEKKIKLKLIAPLIFVIASFFDLLSTTLVIVVLINRLFYHKKEIITFISFLTITIMLFINWLILKQPYINGPFQSSNLITDLITDLGGTSGIGFFILLLALFGITVTWKRKKLYNGYILLPILIITYIINTQTIFLLSIAIVLFASVGFIKLFELRWKLINLKQFTLLLLILGITFSTLTFLDRIEKNGLYNSDKEVLRWIKENTEQNTIVISDLDNSYFIKYFAEREAFNYPHLKDENKNKISNEILNSTYVSNLFPLLGDNKISLIYITKEMKEKLPQPEDQGLLFLLRNERFKLVHSSENSEVWLFVKKKEID